MEQKTFIITDELGLHARPATILTQVAGKYDSDILIEFGEKSVNLKSMMGVLSLGVKQNDEITIKADGSDAEEAIKSLNETLVEQKLIDEKEQDED